MTQEIPEVLRLEAVTAGLDDSTIERCWKNYDEWKTKRFGSGADYSLKTWRTRIQWEIEGRADRIPPAPTLSRQCLPIPDPGPRLTFADWMRAHERAEAAYETPEIGLQAESVYRWWVTQPEPRPDGWSALWAYARAKRLEGP